MIQANVPGRSGAMALRIIFQEDDQGNNVLERKYFTSWKANFIVGLSTMYYILPEFSVSGGLVYNMIVNNHYQNTSEVMHNVQISLGAKYSL